MSNCFCCAPGCPMVGTMSDGKEGWLCFIHAGKDAIKQQVLTIEINRREWLAKSITDLRMSYGSDKWGDVCRAVQHEFAMHQRGDLKANGEKAWNWIRRLENELHAMVTGNLRKPSRNGDLEAA